MTYNAVDTITQGARTAGDIRGQVEKALLRKASDRILLIGSTDSKEASICRTIIDGNMPSTWSTMVLIVLDIGNAANTLPTKTDAQVATAVDTAWTYFLAAKQVG